MRGTLQEVRGKTLRAGVSEHAPWIVRDAAAPSGIEAELVERFAARLGARVSFTWGSEHRLIERLEHRELHLVAAGLDDESPWVENVGFTRPYLETPAETAQGPSVRRHVLAVPPGENAWLRELESFLREERPRIREDAKTPR